MRDPPPLRARDPDPGPPERTGGGARGLVLLLFIGIMLGGGYYIYQQLQGPAPTAVEDLEPWTPPEGSPAEPEPVGGTERVRNAARDDTPAPAPRTRVAAVQREREPEPEPPLPAPVLRTLAPPPATSIPTPAVSEPAPDPQRDVGPAITSAPAQIVTPPPAPTPSVIAPPVRPRWARRPSERDLRAAFPASAQRQNVEGRVVLDCLIGTDLALRCRARSETPQGYGFAAAALRVAQEFRSAPTLMDGRPAAGERAQVALVFKPE